ncbi:hypothetical protein T02_4709 [Trichinella nativa]|uniref:Uncharacterized protein n=1 Tax=Trichinella nativa TaxID=6335 RepID=A0A0V1KLH1_9BILA|nr:hypothetical protein T02_4709 [Trichinella nativa]
MLDKMRSDTIPGYSHVLRERKETIEQLKFLYLPITFGVSEKRLRGIFDEMRNENEFK